MKSANALCHKNKNVTTITIVKYCTVQMTLLPQVYEENGKRNQQERYINT